MSTTFTAPTRTRVTSTPTRGAGNQRRRRSFTEQRRAARRAAADRSLRAQLVKGRSLVQLIVNSRGKESRWPFVAAFALIAGLAVVSLLMVNTATAQTSFTEQALDEELHELTLAEQQLQQEVAAKQAPGQIAQAAQELGMRPGANPGNLVIRPDGSITWVEPPPPPPVPERAHAPVPAPTPDPVPAPSPGADAAATPVPGPVPSAAPDPALLPAVAHGQPAEPVPQEILPAPPAGA